MNFYYYSKDHVLHSVSLATTLCTFLLTVSSVVLFIVFFLKHFVFQFLVNFLAFIYFISRSSSTCFLLSFQSVSISFSHPLQSMKWFSYCSDSSLFQLFFFEQLIDFSLQIWKFLLRVCEKDSQNFYCRVDWISFGIRSPFPLRIFLRCLSNLDSPSWFPWALGIFHFFVVLESIVMIFSYPFILDSWIKLYKGIHSWRVKE